MRRAPKTMRPRQGRPAAGVRSIERLTSSATASRQKPLKAPKETMNVIWLSLVLKLKRVTRSVPRTIISMLNIF
jgi:hypothetical protein